MPSGENNRYRYELIRLLDNRNPAAGVLFEFAKQEKEGKEL
jgi:hypothetical protein